MNANLRRPSFTRTASVVLAEISMENSMTSTAHKMGILAALLFATGWTIGCSPNTPPPATASATGASVAIDDDVAAGLIEHHRYHHHGGVTLFIAMSLDTLGVSPDEQAAVDKIRSAMHDRMEPARIAERNLVTLLADGLAAANIDLPKVDDAVVAVAASAGSAHDATTDALNQLHTVLTAPERAALVDKVEAHWAVWQLANTEKTGPSIPGGGRLELLAMELGLTADQVEKVRVGLGQRAGALPQLDPQEIAAHLRAFGDAFRSETFDAKRLTMGSNANARMVGWGAAHMANFVETLSLVLTPEQRATFAQRLRAHASHDPTARGNP
jgi:Spy/CpxP family protein refolding chaperone